LALIAALGAASLAPREASADTARPHAAYLELLGKGALWGAGYDYQPRPWLSLGAVTSFFILRGERVTTFSPYVGFYPLGLARHRGFVHLGPLLAYKYTPAPVPELPARSDAGVAAEVAAGYEYRDGVLVRVFAMGTAGAGGVHPWFGLSLGWSL
jgi:hypothetical protein